MKIFIQKLHYVKVRDSFDDKYQNINGDFKTLLIIDKKTRQNV